MRTSKESIKSMVNSQPMHFRFMMVPALYANGTKEMNYL